MALALESKYDGTVRFYRESKRAGGNLVAVFPPERDTRFPQRRAGYTTRNGYIEVEREYLRNRCRPADETDGHDMRNAERMLEQIDQRAEYVRELERNGA